MIIFKKWYQESILSLGIVKSKRKEGMTIHMKVRNNHCISVLKPYLYMFFLVFMY